MQYYYNALVPPSDTGWQAAQGHSAQVLLEQCKLYCPHAFALGIPLQPSGLGIGLDSCVS